MENVTSPLLTEVQAILAGSNDVEKLGEVLESTRQGLAGLREDFQGTVAREKEATRRMVGREIQAVEQAFEDYEAVLDSTAGYLQGFDRAYLESGAQNLPLAIARLDLDFLAYREAAMAERGPTTHPGINYLGALVVAVAFPLLFVPHLGLVRTGIFFGLLNAAVAAWALDKQLVLGLNAQGMVLLLLTFILSMLTFGTGRTNILFGLVHMVVFAVFVFLVFVP